MIWCWLGFFALVALLLVFDLGVLHRKAKELSWGAAAFQTACWVALGLAFSGVIYSMYENNWFGAHLRGDRPGHADGADAAITYVSAYLLEQALSVDNIFVIALVFRKFRVPVKYQHRVLFWGILGAIAFRFTMLAGGAVLASRFDWIFYIFGAYLAWQGIKLAREREGEEEERDFTSAITRFRKFVRVADGDYGGHFSVVIDGRRALTTVAICLVVVELTDIVFALDSIPAVMSVSQDTFIMVTSNVFAVLGLRSLYFLVAKAVAKFQYLKLALAVLLVFIGGKMLAHDLYVVPHLMTLLVIAVILTIGIIASIISARRNPPIDPGTSLG